MRFSPGRFNAQLQAMGQPFIWRRAALCPCRDPHSGGARQDCPVCDGAGTTWGKGVPAHAGVVGAKASRSFADFGKWEDGDVMLSVPADSPLWNAGENDRVVMALGHEPFQIRMVRDGAERVRFPVVRLDRCFWLGPTGGAEIECALPRVDTATGALTWPDPDRAPDPGGAFTLLGSKRPEFFLFKDLPISRAHFQGLALPKRMLLKRFDLFGA